MTIREELLFDFAVNMPRVLVTGETTVVDNVKKLLVMTDRQVVVSTAGAARPFRGMDLS